MFVRTPGGRARQRGWDVSPGYEVNSALRSLMPDLHRLYASYPKALPFCVGTRATSRAAS